jgi:hypothetical protein
VAEKLLDFTLKDGDNLNIKNADFIELTSDEGTDLL